MMRSFEKDAYLRSLTKWATGCQIQMSKHARTTHESRIATKYEYKQDDDHWVCGAERNHGCVHQRQARVGVSRYDL